ncbi:MAG: hypothetical protein MUC79_00240 [Thiobacillaceae bacterium]|jgi:hypothetical protein|nr:hypothetical protein [Thiobacillaceae bacterium]
MPRTWIDMRGRNPALVRESVEEAVARRVREGFFGMPSPTAWAASTVGSESTTK